MNSSVPIHNCLFKTNCSHQGLPHRKSLCTGKKHCSPEKKKLKPSYIQCFIYHRMRYIQETHFRTCCSSPLQLKNTSPICVTYKSSSGLAHILTHILPTPFRADSATKNTHSAKDKLETHVTVKQ